MCACIYKCVREVDKDQERRNWGVAGVQCPMIDRSLAVCSNPTVSISFILIHICNPVPPSLLPSLTL